MEPVKSPNLVALDNDDIDLVVDLLEEAGTDFRVGLRMVDLDIEKKALEKGYQRCMTLAETLKAAKT